MAPFSVHPILFHLGPLSLPTFGVLLAAGLMAGLALSERTARRVGIAPTRLWDAGLFAVIAAFVFSRTMLAIEHWHTFRRFPLLLLALPSLTASGLVLTLAATLMWLWVKQVSPLRALEAWTPCGLLIWGFLALGHFAEGSDPGMPTSAVWGVRFPGDTIPQQPIALLVAVLALTLAAVTYRRLQQGKSCAALGLIAAGVGQVLISFLRQPGEMFLLGMDSIEWIGLALVAAGGLLLVQDWWENRR